MGDTRIDNSTSRPSPECDEQTLVCGAQPTPETLVSRPDPKPSAPADDWHPPMLPADEPSERALVAKNMAASKPPTPTGEESFETKGVAHVGLTGARDGVEVDVALHKTKNVTVLEVGGQVSAQQVGPHAAILHGQKQMKVGGVDVTVGADAGTVEYGPGVKNSDGSKGLHVGGNATIVGGQVTVHKEGLGSVTVGAGAGESAEASVGMKQEGNTTEACGQVSALWFTVGACFPVWSSRN